MNEIQRYDLIQRIIAKRVENADFNQFIAAFVKEQEAELKDYSDDRLWNENDYLDAILE